MSGFYQPMIGMPARLAGLLLALTAAGPVTANPFGVERRGGDAIAAILPDYDAETKEFRTADGDVFNTELRVVAPDDSEVLTAETFDDGTIFFRLSDFRKWLAERNLEGS